MDQRDASASKNWWMCIYIFYQTQVRSLPCLVSLSVTARCMTWLMCPWRVKILIPLQKSHNPSSLPYLTDSWQTKPVAEVLSKFWSLRFVKILNQKFGQSQECRRDSAQVAADYFMGRTVVTLNCQSFGWICQSCTMDLSLALYQTKPSWILNFTSWLA